MNGRKKETGDGMQQGEISRRWCHASRDLQQDWQELAAHSYGIPHTLAPVTGIIRKKTCKGKKKLTTIIVIV